MKIKFGNRQKIVLTACKICFKSTRKDLLSQVTISDKFQLKISEICSQLEIEGLRGDIVSTRAAKALAAFEERTEVTLNDIPIRQVIALRFKNICDVIFTNL